jgi:hypothetical protein
MMDKFLALLERFVVAHELLAANSAKPAAAVVAPAAPEPVAEEAPKAPAKRTRAPAKAKAAPVEEEEEPVNPAKGKKAAPDLDTLRDEIKTMATHIAEGESDECADEFDDLLEDFRVRTVTKISDADVEDFHRLAKELVGKYYEIED